jgi:transcriptional regulator with XRE-family HTH domain
MKAEEVKAPQRLSDKDFADIVRASREMRQWSQDTLAAISRLNIRTIQRVEKAEPSNGDTRRAIARAFELEDMDIFNKPFTFPSPEEIQAETERMRREHITLDSHIAKTGQELTRFFEQANMDYASSAVELEGTAAESFADLIDYLREFRDCKDCMNEAYKLRVFSDVQGYLDMLGKAGYSISYARRETKLVGENWADKTPWAVTVAYLVVFPKGNEPKALIAPRQVHIGT